MYGWFAIGKDAGATVVILLGQANQGVSLKMLLVMDLGSRNSHFPAST